MGYVERNASGRTELRVHGVAGTAPESVLQHPHTEQVAGNRDAGFFRRWWEAQSVSADSPGRRREAYSWGGLTSGDNLRALWLLLLPFMLLNVAFYMAPYRRPPEPDEPTGWRERWTVWRRGWWSTPRRDRRRDRFSASVQRLLALSFTVTFTLTAITVAMDLVGWKCAAPATGDVCGTSWLGWLDAAWLRDRPGRQVAVTALLPLAVVGLLWWLAGATWDKLERVRPPASDTAARPVEIETPLEDRAMWNGRGPVRRLRAVHVATGLALPGVFALAPVQANSAWRPTVLLALVAFLVAMVRRRRASHDRAPGAAVPRHRQGGRRRAAEPVPLPALVRARADRARARRGGDGHGVRAAGDGRHRRGPEHAAVVGGRAAVDVPRPGRAARAAPRGLLEPDGGGPGGRRRTPTPERSAGSASGPRGAGTPCPRSRCSPGCSPAGSRRASSCARRTPSGRPSPPGTGETTRTPSSSRWPTGGWPPPRSRWRSRPCSPRCSSGCDCAGGSR